MRSTSLQQQAKTGSGLGAPAWGRREGVGGGRGSSLHGRRTCHHACVQGKEGSVTR